MNYTGTISVPIDEVARLERFCRVPPGRKNCNGRDVPLFDQEYTFPNGVRMAIQVCPSTDPDIDPCWTQGVLFDHHGFELGCTEVGLSLLGEYHVPDGDDTYVVEVRRSRMTGDHPHD
ncbi:MAG: hypothetical protein ACLQNE_22320 [Thermoguttaceae bacterium]|jgi:hypothetical protein